MDITLRSAGEQAAAVAGGEISAGELLEEILGRYERFNPAINAVVFTQIEAARQRAMEADAATTRGQSWGPLHGVPMTIKEAWDWVGSPTTLGHPELVDWIAALQRGGISVESLAAEMPFLAVLLKRDNDVEAVLAMRN